MGNDADTAEVEAEHTLATIVNAEAKSDHLVDETALFVDMARRSFEAALELTETPNKWSSPGAQLIVFVAEPALGESCMSAE